MAEKEAAAEIIRNAERLVGQRGVLNNHLREVAERILPSHSRAFQMVGVINQTKGDKRTEHSFDATASLALVKFGAVMESILTPRASRWQRIVPSDKAILQNRAAREWFDDTTNRLFAYRYSPQANFSSQKQENYIQIGAFGTGPFFTDKFHGAPGLRYKACDLADVYFTVDHQGIVDEVYRRITLSARQAHGRWGAKLPEQITNKLEKSPETEFVFWHCAKKRQNVEYGRLDYKGMPFSSHYVSVTGTAMLEEGGYHSFPYQISRYSVAPGETYGRGPAMMVLPNIKVLNEQKRTVLRQGHRAVDPVLLAHDDGVLDAFSMKPGAMNYGGVNADGRALVHALPVGNLAIAKEMMQEERMVIREAFLLNLFEILVEDRRDMTATEVLHRAQEKGVLMAPTMGRQHSEDLGPMTVREIDLLAQQGLLMPVPEYLRGAGGEYKMEYDSPLSRMQRAEEAAGFLEIVNVAIEVAAKTQNPAPLDWLDFDTAIPEIADLKAVPVRWISSIAKVAAMRQGRNQTAQTQQLVEALPGIAGLTKSLQPA
jgi:hypothetical protein